MGAASGLTTGAEIGFYIKLESPPAPATPASGYVYSDVVGAGKLVTDNDDNFIAECTDIGGITKTANTKEVGFFRAKAKRKIAGIPTFEDMTFSLALDHSIAAHKALRDANVGTACHLAIVWNTDPAKQEAVETSTQVSVAYILGEIGSSSVNAQLDDETTGDVVVTPSRDVIWLDQA